MTKTNFYNPTLPAWDGEDTYPHLRDASNEMLAWEFLRRNLAYQKLCDDEFQAYPNHRNSEIGTDPHDMFLHEMDLDLTDPNNTIINPSLPWAIKTKFSKMGEMDCFREFGVFLLVRPELDVFPCGVVQSLFVRPRIFGTEVGGFRKKRKTITAKGVPGSFVAYLFDVSSDLSPQLASAKQELKGVQIFAGPIPEYTFIKKKGPTKPWQKFIWLLDAQKLGFTVAEIRVLLHGEDRDGDRKISRERTIRSQLKMSNQQMNGGYKKLLL